MHCKIYLLATSSYNICHILRVTFANSLTLIRCSLDLETKASALIWIQIVWHCWYFKLIRKKVILNKISRLSIQISKHTKIYKTQSIQDSMNRPNIECITFIDIYTLVNVYVDLVVFTRIAGIS